MKQLISIVMPLYNKSQFIERAILSVLKQSYKNFELLVIDDGSTDGGGDLVKEIPDPRIRLFRQENSGVSAARNRGIEKANSEFIVFLDADDEWKTEQLFIFYQLIYQFPDCSFFAQSYVYIHNGSNIIPSSLRKFPINWTGYLDNYLDLAVEFPPFFTSSVCIRKDLLIKADGFPEGINIAEDLSLWLKLFFMTRFCFCHSLNSFYYFGESNNLSLTKRIQFGHFERLLEKYLSQPGISKTHRNKLFEYYTSRLLYICSQNLLYDNRQYCQSLLNKCKETQRFKARWKRLYLFSYLPRPVYKFLFSTWKKIKKF